jgi:hypothetical protein
MIDIGEQADGHWTGCQKDTADRKVDMDDRWIESLTRIDGLSD